MATIKSWFLEGWSLGSVTPWRIGVAPLPFRVGRRHGVELALGSALVSKLHARIFEKGDSLWLEDLGSTNGTMLNLEPVSSPSEMREGDLVYFADKEFRLISIDEDESEITIEAELGDIRSLEEAAPLFRQMLEAGSFHALFQPVVTRDETCIGYEFLSRGDQEGLPSSPAELFRIAEEMRMETELVTVLRLQGLSETSKLPGNPLVLFNTHPKEIEHPQALLDGLRRAREEGDGVPLVLEIHEMTVTDLDSFRELCAGLNDLDIQLAFDDFGAGRARFLELAELSPQFVKFDKRLIRRLESASPKRLELIRGLVRTIADLGIETIAEGIETSDEAEICWSLGFEYAQGFYYGHPENVEQIASAANERELPLP